MLQAEGKSGNANQEDDRDQVFTNLLPAFSGKCLLEGKTGDHPGLETTLEMANAAMEASFMQCVRQFDRTFIALGHKEEIMVRKFTAQQQTSCNVVASGNMAAPELSKGSNVNHELGTRLVWALKRRPHGVGTDRKASHGC